MLEAAQTSESERFSDRLEGWFQSPGPKTLGSLTELFQEKSFAVLFVLLLAISALPLPTGGVTHVFELIAMLLALELIAGRTTVWLPERWKRRELGGDRASERLLKWIRWLERHSRPALHRSRHPALARRRPAQPRRSARRRRGRSDRGDRRCDRSAPRPAARQARLRERARPLLRKAYE
jgi:hypothetical protein